MVNPTNKWPDDRWQLAKKLWAEGETASMIALKVSLGDFRPTKNSVLGKIHREGAQRRGVTVKTQKMMPGMEKRVSAKIAERKLPAKAPITFGRRLSATDSKGAYAKRMASIQSEHDARMERIDAEAPTDGSGVTLVELKYGQCKWPLGDPLSSRFRFCGGEASGNTYCSNHARMAYVPRVVKK